MLKFTFPVILTMSFFMSCASVTTKEPDWMTNTKSVYPDAFYLAQKGSGSTVDMAKTDAAAALSRYFNVTVQSTLSTSIQSKQTNNLVEDNISVSNNTTMDTFTRLFALEYTDGYYNKAEKKWYCLAFIDRKMAWAQFEPQIIEQRTTFYDYYYKARETPEPLLKYIYDNYAAAQSFALLKSLNFGDILFPEQIKKYSDDLLVIASLPRLQTEEKLSSIIFITVKQDYNNIIESKISELFSKNGFLIGGNLASAKYTILVEIEPNDEKSEVFSYFPGITLTIQSKSGVLFSYNTTITKVSANNQSVAIKRAYQALAKELDNSFMKSFNVQLDDN